MIHTPVLEILQSTSLCVRSVRPSLTLDLPVWSEEGTGFRERSTAIPQPSRKNLPFET